MRDHQPAPDHNLFRRKDCPDLYCAVPEGRPVPFFIRDPAWEFAGRHRPQSPGLMGFREQAARVALQHQGFYVFESFH